jgi:cytochrome P450
MKADTEAIPTISTSNGLPILKELATQRSLLAGMEAMHNALGNIFEINMPGFKPIVVSGPEAAREILVTEREQFNWRNPSDPVTRLLRHGLLVEDGEDHELLRSYMQPALQRTQVNDYLPKMLSSTDRVINSWEDGSLKDMLVEMRRLALMILMETLFSVDIAPDLPRLWEPILKVLSYISPGLWLVNSNLPRPGYRKSIEELDEYLYTIIRERRLNDGDERDMLADLINREDMTDDLIRDQMLTMLIAGHDTSTALLSWALYLLGKYPEVMLRAKSEIDDVLGSKEPTLTEINQLHYLEQVIKETLRLFPPIHVGNRIANMDQNLMGCPVPVGSRVMLSYYLTHRDERNWEQAERFNPKRFDRQSSHNRSSFSYLPFGGGPRNCIGAAFAQIESRLVLARIIQKFNLELVSPSVRKHMGATLEPTPQVLMRVTRRTIYGDSE